MATRTLPSQDYLRQRFDYDPETGELRWKPRPLSEFKTAAIYKRWNTMHAGKSCGTRHSEGYTSVSLDGSWPKKHRIIWKLVHGEDPKIVDHIDRDRTNDRIENLRNCDDYQNAWNSSQKSNNRSGYRGVFAYRGAYRAVIKYRGKQFHLGTFSDPAEGHKAYQAAAQRLHGEYAPRDQ